ncbi:hypothetical protein ACE6H2_004312 [Prunus campanulata]
MEVNQGVEEGFASNQPPLMCEFYCAEAKYIIMYISYIEMQRSNANAPVHIFTD